MPATPLIRWINSNTKQIFVQHNGTLIPCVSFIEAVNRCKEINQGE